MNRARKNYGNNRIYGRVSNNLGFRLLRSFPGQKYIVHRWRARAQDMTRPLPHAGDAGRRSTVPAAAGRAVCTDDRAGGFDGGGVY